ncbi:hypothetical protein [Fonticella tunisiensis]|uniref:Uncharacterized protein n=1 Tax=Fonticella tunisiensis TaxID=1096341 RepID=A0A4R7KPF6_9CLOT|nr:hypothetical protein [Fonticella tunisiensis]TDT61001.1 hypothetical protein EDD71_1093 [Fonticella tunisiensis]
MAQIIKLLSNFTNDIHDLLLAMSNQLGYNFNDKQLHFIIVGLIGIVLYFFTDVTFKALAKYSISIISFIYTFTVLIVFVFALEIEQKITGRGNMEFSDIVAGLWGFIEAFGIYLAIKIIIYLAKMAYKSISEKAR